MSARTLITAPSSAKRGEVISLRALIQHPMETGYRRGSDGALLVRDLIRQFRCEFVSGNAPNTAPILVFQASLHAATAANPFIAFGYRASESGTLVFTWAGDKGFAHSERRALTVA
jgi:sulfur-oxidizing protein SoxZ